MKRIVWIITMLFFISMMFVSCDLLPFPDQTFTAEIRVSNFSGKDLWIVFCQHELQNRSDSLTVYVTSGYSLFALNEELTCRYDSVYELLNYQTTTFVFWYGRNVSIQEHFRLANIDSLCILTFNSRSDGIEWIRERKDSLLNKKYSYSLADIDSRYAAMSVELK